MESTLTPAQNLFVGFAVGGGCPGSVTGVDVASAVAVDAVAAAAAVTVDGVAAAGAVAVVVVVVPVGSPMTVLNRWICSLPSG